MKLRHFWIFGMVCVLLSATAFSAQSTTATIQGLVSDEQKALVPGVTITARNLETNATRSAVSNDDTSRMTVAELLKAGGSSLYSILPSGVRVGNVGRNTLRADGIGNVDFGFIKNTRVKESQNIQFRVEMYNATNPRNFGIPEGRVNSSNFLNQWGTDGGNRRIIVALRYTF